MLEISLLATALLLAWANGANDNFKGVASLHASRTLGFRPALLLGTGSTLLGSVASLFLAADLIGRFSGKGLVPEAVAGTGPFLLAVGIGAGGTVLLATRLGIPISTTHALVGGILGSGAVAAGSALRVSQLATVFVAPLLLSPVVAVVGAATMHRVTGPLQGILRTAGGIPKGRVRDTLHLVSAALVSFARGVNDTPKIAALLLASDLLGARVSLLAVGIAMALGGIVGAARVARTLGRRMVVIDRDHGVSANLVTAVLVLWASRLGLPVSTTHVSVGALAGIGFTDGQLDLGVARTVALSWVLTLPLAALLAVLAYGVFGG